ncbi:MAG: DUF1189 domain-containing protein [Candidatus Obscuribacterales bacterium]|nr:DUF1189 domain-containing protein [Candidatus Obscuribacterales bacterium]
MKQFKIWQAPVLGFFSTQFYRDLAANGKGVGFLYLLALLSLSCLIGPVRQFFDLSEFMKRDGSALIEQFPAIKIENGKLSIDRPSPYYITSGDIAWIGFFTDEKSEKEIDQQNIPMVVTSSELRMRLSQTDQGTAVPFRDIPQYSLSRLDIDRIFKVSCFTVPIMGYGMLLGVAWPGHIMAALLLSVVALITAKLIGVRSSYDGLLRVSSVAVGTTIIINTFNQLVHLEFPGITDGGTMFIVFLVAFGYTIFGTGANLSQPAFVPHEQEPVRDYME